MGYLLATAIIFNRSSMFNPSMRYFSSQITYPGKWWGPGTENSATNDIKPYNIIFSEERIKDLKYKLRNSDILKKPMLDKIGHYDKKNINMFLLSKVLHHWAYNYDFKGRERYINRFPHFMTNIQGLDIHFIHVKRRHYYMEQHFMPLLLLHGWQSSIMEIYNGIPFDLRKEREIIIPSLPGFGFSSAPTIPGFSLIDMSVVLKNLMLRLGHDRFNLLYNCYNMNGYIMSILLPQHVNNHKNLYNNDPYWEKAYFFSKFIEKVLPIKEVLKEFGYFRVQASEMNTVEIDLNNSPAALAAYFLHEILNRTYPSGSFKKYSSKKRLFSHTHTIDNLMMYWAPQCINTAMQVYAEQFNNLPDEFVEFVMKKL